LDGHIYRIWEGSLKLATNSDCSWRIEAIYICIIYLIQQLNLNTSRHNILQYLDYICIVGESTWLCHEQIQCIRINNETRLPTLYPDKWLSNVVKMNLINQFKQTWSTSIDNSSKALNYRLYKKGVSFENYLEILKDKNLFLLCRSLHQNFIILTLISILMGYLPSSPSTMQSGVEVFRCRSSLQNFKCILSII
jgi:hypothetical protein